MRESALLCLWSAGNRSLMLFSHPHPSESPSRPLPKPIPCGLKERIFAVHAVVSRFDRSRTSPAIYLKNQTAVILPPSTR